MPVHTPPRLRGALLAMAAGTLLSLAGMAAEADDGRRLQPASPPAAWRQECASCHVAYPPALLPAESWQRLMANLPRHFGTDASLDAATAASLSAWLQREAGSGRRVAAAPPDARITRGAWFQREHRDVAPATWKRPAVKSPANCAACHTRADQGDFNEDQVRIPR